MAPDALLQAETSINSLPLIEKLTELRADERALRRELMERSICLPIADLVDPNELSKLHQNVDQLSAYLTALLERDKQLLLRLEQHCSLAASSAPVPNDTLFVEPEHQRAFADGCLQMAQFLGSKMHRIEAQLQVFTHYICLHCLIICVTFVRFLGGTSGPWTCNLTSRHCRRCCPSCRQRDRISIARPTR
jgi:hypothetical protein